MVFYTNLFLIFVIHQLNCFMKQLMIALALCISTTSFGQFVKREPLLPISVDSLDYDEFKILNEPTFNINGMDRFLKQHRTGNHIMIVGAIVSTVGCLFIGSTYHKDFTDNNFVPGMIMTTVGSGILATGWVVNIDSFKHLRRR